MRLASALAATLLLAPLAACGSDSDPTSPDPSPSSASPSASATPEPSAEPTQAAIPSTSADLVIAPGKVGAAEVGMSKADAVATGLFDTDVTVNPGVCERVEPLQWKPAFSNIDIITDPSGTIVSIGVFGRPPATADGLGIGSTWAQVRAVHPSATIEEVGFLQGGTYVQDGDRWLGFLFGETSGTTVPDNSVVTFVEVGRGQKPALIRDGC